MTGVAPTITRADVERLGLAAADEAVRVEPLSGGVSSDIVKVTAANRVFIVKRALARLRVADEWLAPVSRNRHEADWFDVVAGILPGAVPAVLARDDEAGMFAMEYFDPRVFPVWKERLRDGEVDVAFAGEVGRRLAVIHAHTAGDTAIAGRFATGPIFEAIRLEPYLETCARRHPEAAGRLRALYARTLATKTALVHGDISPKNILAGAGGPVFLDAECAWFGDPAFDPAFCLNHLLLKSLWNRAAGGRLLEAFDRLAAAYLSEMRWEPREEMERRIAELLSGLLLARVDGKSPVEYLGVPERELVRGIALGLIRDPAASPYEVRRIWAGGVGL